MIMIESSEKEERRNFILNAIEGVFYAGTAGFLSTQTTLPAVAQVLGGDTTTIGLIPLIGFAGWFLPQLLTVRILHRYPVRKDFVFWVGVPQRFSLLLIAVAILIFASERPLIALNIFLVLYIVNQLLTGLSTPAWYDMMSKVTPQYRRGRLLGFRTAVGTLIALGTGLLLTVILAHVRYPLNYAFIFFGAFFLQMCSLLVVRQIREAPTPGRAVTEHSEISLAMLRSVLQSDNNFRNLIVVCILLTSATMSNAFFIGYGFSKYHLSKEFIGQWTMVMMAGQIIGSLIMGFIGDRYGYRRALFFASLCIILTVVTALFSQVPMFYGVVFLFLGMNLGMDMMSRFNMTIEIAPDDRRPVYVALLNTIVAPFYLLSLAAGVLIKSTGYEGIFILSALFAIGAMGWLFLRVRDPRDIHV